MQLAPPHENPQDLHVNAAIRRIGSGVCEDVSILMGPYLQYSTT